MGDNTGPGDPGTCGVQFGTYLASESGKGVFGSWFSIAGRDGVIGRGGSKRLRITHTNTFEVFVVFVVYDVYDVLVGAKLQLLPTVYTHLFPASLPLCRTVSMGGGVCSIVPIEPRYGSIVISGL